MGFNTCVKKTDTVDRTLSQSISFMDSIAEKPEQLRDKALQIRSVVYQQKSNF